MKRVFCLLALGVFSFFSTGCGPNIYSSEYISQQIQNNRTQWTTEIQHELLVSKIQILPENWENLVKNSIANLLKDPDSAKYKFDGEPQLCGFSNKGKYPSIYSIGSSPLIGFIGGVLINAKNSFGGYTGDEMWIYIISNGEIKYITNNHRWSNTYQGINHINNYEVIIFPDNTIE